MNFLGLPIEKTGADASDCPRYYVKKIGKIIQNKFTFVEVGSGELGFVYAMKRKENGDYCWYGPQQKFRPNIGMRMLVSGGHFSDWIATSAVQAYSVINDPEGADKLIIGKDILDAGFKLPEDLELRDGDVIFMTRNSFYVAFKKETPKEYQERKNK